MATKSTVYLDQIIERENLRYHRPIENFTTSQPKDSTLQFRDLIGNSERLRLIRKPDFQRATWAWTPQDCVDLIESVVSGRVIPGIIMWTSPSNNLDYILDGGHRVSVLIAWLNDRWGDSDADIIRFINDPEQRNEIKEAAREVRNHLNARRDIGAFEEYRKADEQFSRITDIGEAPKRVMAEDDYKKAMFYRDYIRGSKSFHVTWVTGDYLIAETSFLKINKSGKQLSQWETRLIEDRDSAFIRCIMSLSNPNSSKHYWPTDKSFTEDHSEVAKNIEAMSHFLYDALFEPKIVQPVTSMTLPFMVTSPADQSRWIAEILTITEKKQGQDSETDELIRQYRETEPINFLIDGHKVLGGLVRVFEHLDGPNNQPLSLGIVPSIYFYSGVRYVRSLFYGFIYWMFQGDDGEIRNRKLNFSAHRGAFETLFLANKELIIKTISRGIGSGPEVTKKTANLFQAILEALTNNVGDLEDPKVKTHIKTRTGLVFTIENLISESESRTRGFSKKQKSQHLLEELTSRALRCGICDGVIDPNSGTQHDHIMPHHQGGLTNSVNQRIVHPFCNNNREVIEGIQSGQRKIPVPVLRSNPESVDQLKLFPDEYFE